MNNTGFNVEVETHESVGDLKAKIHAASLEAGGAELVVDRQTLICRGKKLTDSSALISDISGLEAEEEPYMVCMLSKEKKAKATTPAPAPAPAVATSSTGTSGTIPDTITTAATTTTTTPTATTTTAPAPAPAAAPVQNFVEEATLASLQEMSGLPEPQCRAALQAAMGDPNVAFEFLMSGIPPGMENGAAAMAGAGTDLPAAPTGGAAAGGIGIEALRNHPQFAQLQATVQQNPSALPQILQLIGQQQPELLQAIHENEAAFLEMMNEPINASPPAAPTAAGGQAGNPMADMTGAMAGMGGGAGGRPNPAMLMQLLATLPPEQRAAFATQLGLSAEQLQGLMAALQQVPPDQLAAMMNQMGGEEGGLPGMGGGGPPPGSIALTQEEMAAVNRLQELGFSQSQAAQAYIASDKNEEVAANLLFGGTFNFDDDEGAGGGF